MLAGATAAMHALAQELESRGLSQDGRGIKGTTVYKETPGSSGLPKIRQHGSCPRRLASEPGAQPPFSHAAHGAGTGAGTSGEALVIVRAPAGLRTWHCPGTQSAQTMPADQAVPS